MQEPLYLVLHEFVSKPTTAAIIVAHRLCVKSNMCFACRGGLMNSKASAKPTNDTQPKFSKAPRQPLVSKLMGTYLLQSAVKSRR